MPRDVRSMGPQWRGTAEGTDAMQEGPESKSAPAMSAEFLLATVGARVREARKRANLSQTDLAKLIGTGQSYVFQIEAGEANVTLKTLARVAAAVGLSPSALLPGEDLKQLSAMLHAAIRELDRVSDQLRKACLLVADDPSAPVPGTPPKS